jgi:hypothetical protein
VDTNTVAIGDLSIYPGTNWSLVCAEGLSWFGQAHSVPLDVTKLLGRDLYNDEYGLPSSEATTYAQAQATVVVNGKMRTWRVRAYVKRVSEGSTYYYLTAVALWDVTRGHEKRLCTYHFECDEYDTTRSRVISINGQVPAHQLGKDAV